jgi:hypothetical protein
MSGKVVSVKSTENGLEFTTGGGGGGSGTVTSFSAGLLSPLFTTSVATATTTPALSFALTNAAATTVFGRAAGSSGAPTYSSAPQFLKIGNLTTNGFVKTGSSDGTLSVDTSTYLTGPAGSNTQIQFNDSSAFGGVSGFTFDKTNLITTLTGNVNSVMDYLVQNTNTSTGGQATFIAKNSTNQANYGITSTGLTPAGSILANEAYLYTDSPVGLLLMENNATGPIIFAPGGLTERARFVPSGGFNVGATSDPGVGVINANVGFKLGGAEFPVASNGLVKRTAANTYSVITDSSTNWDTAFSHDRQWDGGATGLVAATGRTSLSLVIGTNVQAWDTDLDTWAAITRASGIDTWVTTPSSANLRGALTDENGTGAALFNGATTPDFTTGFTIGAAAASGKIPIGNGTNYVPSTPTYPNAAGAAGYSFKSDATNFSSYPSHLFNSSTSSQSPSTSDVYVAGSNVVVAAGDFKAKGQYKCVFDVTKSAGTGGIVISVRTGTLGTTGDTANLTFTFAAGTSVADTGTFEVIVNWRTVGSGTSAVVSGVCRAAKNTITAAGLWGDTSAAKTIVATVSSGFASNTFTNMGVSFNGGTAFAGTITTVQATLMQP